MLVAVPARDEAGSIEACLRSICRAVAFARQRGVVARARVAIAAHRCRDATATLAQRVLTDAGVDHLVVADTTSTTVGAVRTRLVGLSAAAPPAFDPDRTWLLSTDADSTVPVDWVSGLLEAADRTGADLVAGFVALDGWQADPAARQAYEQRILTGLTADGHRHVWAANLVVRLSTFQTAGGFPSVVHGEERALADQVARFGTVVGALHPVVSTSARMPGRATHGLGELLRELARSAVPEPT